MSVATGLTGIVNEVRRLLVHQDPRVKAGIIRICFLEILLVEQLHDLLMARRTTTRNLNIRGLPSRLSPEMLTALVKSFAGNRAFVVAVVDNNNQHRRILDAVRTVLEANNRTLSDLSRHLRKTRLTTQGR